MKGLADRVVVIAGGATGIGAATAHRLADEGAKVLVGDINGEGAERTAAAILASGRVAAPFTFDLAEEESCQALIAAAKSRFGAVHGLFNVGADLSMHNLGRDSDILSVPNEVIVRTLTVNLVGYVYTSRHAIPEILAAGGGSIVHTTSAVILGAPKFCAYAMSKGGVVALSRHIATRWGKQGLRSNAIDPGTTITQTHIDHNTEGEREARLRNVKSKRFGEPEEIAAMVAFLLSPEARWINGQTYGVSSQEAAR